MTVLKVGDKVLTPYGVTSVFAIEDPDSFELDYSEIYEAGYTDEDIDSGNIDDEFYDSSVEWIDIDSSGGNERISLEGFGPVVVASDLTYVAEGEYSGWRLWDDWCLYQGDLVLFKQSRPMKHRFLDYETNFQEAMIDEAIDIAEKFEHESFWFAEGPLRIGRIENFVSYDHHVYRDVAIPINEKSEFLINITPKSIKPIIEIPRIRPPLSNDIIWDGWEEAEEGDESSYGPFGEYKFNQDDRFKLIQDFIDYDQIHALPGAGYLHQGRGWPTDMSELGYIREWPYLTSGKFVWPYEEGDDKPPDKGSPVLPPPKPPVDPDLGTEVEIKVGEITPLEDILVPEEEEVIAPPIDELIVPDEEVIVPPEDVSVPVPEDEEEVFEDDFVPLSEREKRKKKKKKKKELEVAV